MVRLESRDVNNINIPVCTKKINMYTVTFISSIATLMALMNQLKSGVYMPLNAVYMLHTMVFLFELLLVYTVLRFWENTFGVKEIQINNGSISLICGPITQVTLNANIIVDDKLDSKFVSKLREQYITVDPVVITIVNDGGSKNFVVDRENVKELCNN